MKQRPLRYRHRMTQANGRGGTDFMNTYEVPGVSVAIASLAYVEAFGMADRESGEALTPQRRFRIASISKPIGRDFHTHRGAQTLLTGSK
jgi:CubicO group peptidase (beta-lactamase class C family)